MVILTFLSDLDNTLIYSRRHEISESKIVAEHLNGRKQSFITERTYSFLRDSEWLEFIPVTTRTEEQYRRIACFDEIRVRYALTCNGGKLLVNGIEDTAWSDDTLRMSKITIGELNIASGLLRELCSGSELHNPEKYMYYAKCDAPREVSVKLKALIDNTVINVEHDNRKVYMFAHGVDKGNAVERLKERFFFEDIIAAGDDYMDVPMLDRADIALSGNKIFGLLNARYKVDMGEGIISDRICDYLEYLLNKGKG